MEEFSVSIWFKIVLSICIILFVGVEIYFFAGTHPYAGFWGSLYEMSVPIMIIMFMISRFARKVIISADSIVSVRLFGRREILTSNVKGIKFTRNGVIIQAVSPPNFRIAIYALDQLANDEYLTKWLSENFIDLNKKGKN